MQGFAKSGVDGQRVRLSTLRGIIGEGGSENHPRPLSLLSIVS